MFNAGQADKMIKAIEAAVVTQKHGNKNSLAMVAQVSLLVQELYLLKMTLLTVLSSFFPDKKDELAALMASIAPPSVQVLAPEPEPAAPSQEELLALLQNPELMRQLVPAPKPKTPQTGFMKIPGGPNIRDGLKRTFPVPAAKPKAAEEEEGQDIRVRTGGGFKPVTQ